MNTVKLALEESRANNAEESDREERGKKDARHSYKNECTCKKHELQKEKVEFKSYLHQPSRTAAADWRNFTLKYIGYFQSYHYPAARLFSKPIIFSRRG